MFAFATLAVWIGVMVKQARQGNRRLVTWIYWGVLIVTVLLADHYLLFKNIEYIHYPQYAFLALLLSKCLDPERKRFCVGKVLFWTTFLGVIDEMFQYFYLCSSYGDYLDFNDLFLNLQGAVVGTLLYYGFKSASLKKRKLSKKFFNSAGFRTIMVFIILIVFFAGSGRLKVSPSKTVPPGGIVHVDGTPMVFLERKPGIFGSWNKGAHRKGTYYVLTPGQGLALLILAGGFFASFGRPVRQWKTLVMGENSARVGR